MVRLNFIIEGFDYVMLVIVNVKRLIVIVFLLMILLSFIIFNIDRFFGNVLFGFLILVIGNDWVFVCLNGCFSGSLLSFMWFFVFIF